MGKKHGRGKGWLGGKGREMEAMGGIGVKRELGEIWAWVGEE